MAKQKDKLTQKEAVKQALAAGKESPADGVAYVKEQFGITLNNGAFSTLKSQLKKGSGKGSTRGRKPGRPAASANGASRTGGSSSSGKAANPADLARTVKALVNQYGAEAVRDMASVFAD